MNKKFFVPGLVALSLVTGVSASSSASVSDSTVSNNVVSQQNSSILENGKSVSVQTAKKTVKKVTKVNVNLRKGKSTKYSIIKTLKKNTTVVYVSKSGSWTKVKAGSKTGWVVSSALKNAPVTKSKPKPKPTPKKTANQPKDSGIVGGSAAKTQMKKATSKQQRDWTASLPYACKVPQIKDIKLTNTKRKSYKISGHVRYDDKGKPYYKLYVDGKLAPYHPAAKALMKHECGHVLTYIYKNRKGAKSYESLMNKGWKSSDNMRNEKVADCISDYLGGVRKTKTYKVGYGTVCNSKQKSVAKTLTNYGKNLKP